MKHYSVLKDEVISGLNIKEDGIYVDATLGYAGDSLEILRRLKRGYLFAFDKDLEAISYSKEVLMVVSPRFQLVHSSFKNMKEELNKFGITKVDGILFDLGVSSPQIDERRGFTYMRDEQLDMRMDGSSGFSAIDVVNTYDSKELKKIIFEYGEEKKAPFIVDAIIKYRSKKKIETTLELVNIIKSSVSVKYFNEHHPERKVFQAIRIEVNHELDELKEALPMAIDLLKPDGRLAVITFHSLEDRIVKNTFKKYSMVDKMVKGLPNIPKEYLPKINLINKKVILPSEKELRENSRSRSAKLRIVERTNYDTEEEKKEN